MTLEIVLVEPEIPQNTGNIARTCVATGSRLHLVEPLGFSIEDRQVRRAGLDYWPDLELRVWPDLASLMQAFETADQASPEQTGLFPELTGLFYVTTKGQQVYSDVTYPERTILFFGKETKGLPETLLQAAPQRCIRIPMLPGRRSLNLSNAVAVMAYEVMRQQGFPGLKKLGPSEENRP